MSDTLGWPLHGRVILVTGAARRIGRSIALRLASEGARVLIHYSTSREGAERTAAECAALSDALASAPEDTPDRPLLGNSAPLRSRLGNAGARLGNAGDDAAQSCYQADLTSVADISRMFAEIAEREGRLDGLVNNAARFTRIDPLSITEADWDSIHDVNLKATFFCAQQAARLILRDPEAQGRIVNISSMGAFLAWADHAHYCASKAGVVALTRALAKAWAPRITVNSVAPGAIPFEERDTPAIQALARSTPVGRVGTGKEIAAAVHYFLTASNFVTGQTLQVDGGMGLR
jgi:3-oxoacyl-[acyl-carrier protein] reductase/pteridine reductase